MHSRTSAVETSTSTAGTMPLPSARGTSRWLMMPLMTDDEDETDLIALVLGEGRDGARDGLARVERVQRAHHQVARLGGEDRRLDGLEVAHLADQDDVGVLAQGTAQRLGERLAVVADLALGDDAELVLCACTRSGSSTVMMCRSRVHVDVVDHRRERGALAAAGRPGDEDQAAMLERDLLDDRRQVEVADGAAPAAGSRAARR